MAALQHLTATNGTGAEWGIVALAFISCAHCLRASEAITAHVDGDDLIVTSTESHLGEQRQGMGPWTVAWAGLLVELRDLHGYHLDRPAWFRGRGMLHQGLVGILDSLGGSHKGLQWHSFRRYGSASAPRTRRRSALHHTVGWMAHPCSGRDLLQSPAHIGIFPGRAHPTTRVARRDPGVLKVGTTLTMWPSWVKRELEVPAL